jgi:branched-chain amino acid transport system substrate-binding protein
VSQLDRRQVLRLFGGVAAAGAAGALAACGIEEPGAIPEPPSGRKIKIGLLAPATGPYLTVGADITQGFKLYLAANGNRLGRHDVELLLQDEGGTVASAQDAADKLIKAGVSAIAGVANPAALSGIRDLVEKARVPVISCSASPNDLTSVFYIWRAAYVDGQASRVLGEHLAERTPLRRAFVLHDDTDSMQAEANEFGRAFATTGRFIAGTLSGSAGLAAKMQAARNSNADMIYAAYAGDTGFDVVKAYRDARTLGLKLPLYGPGSLTENRNLGKLVEGRAVMPNGVSTVMNYAVDLDNDPNTRFASTYHKLNGVLPTAYAMAAYDSASVINSALRLIGEETRPFELNRGLGLLGEIQSPRGTWTFTVNRTPQQKWYMRSLRLDGQEPANLVEADLALNT